MPKSKLTKTDIHIGLSRDISNYHNLRDNETIRSKSVGKVGQPMKLRLLGVRLSNLSLACGKQQTSIRAFFGGNNTTTGGSGSGDGDGDVDVDEMVSRNTVESTLAGEELSCDILTQEEEDLEEEALQDSQKPAIGLTESKDADLERNGSTLGSNCNWSCSSCTYENPPLVLVCLMCDSQRPAPASTAADLDFQCTTTMGRQTVEKKKRKAGRRTKRTAALDPAQPKLKFA